MAKPVAVQKREAKKTGTAADLSPVKIQQIAKYKCLGYSDKAVALRLRLKLSIVKDVQQLNVFMEARQEAENEITSLIRDRQRRIILLALSGLERLLKSRDEILVNYGVEKFIQLAKKGFIIETPDDDDSSDTRPVSSIAGKNPPPALGSPQNPVPADDVKSKIAQLTQATQ